MSDSQKKLSFASIMDAFGSARERFSLTATYAAAFTLWSVFLILIGGRVGVSSSFAIAGLYFTSIATLATLAIYLWTEWLAASRRKILLWAVSLLLFIDAFYLFATDTSAYWVVGRLALITALLVGICFCVSRYEKVAWLYTVKTLSALAVAVVYGLVFLFAWGATMVTITFLFKAEVMPLLQAGLMIGSVYVPFVIFLYRLPRRDELTAAADAFHVGRFLSGTAKYFILPLVVIYLAVLYVYALRILFTLELPQGVIVMAVSGLAAAVLATIFLFDGVSRSDPDDKFSAKVGRTLSWAMLPLIVLMSVAIGYRVAEYGWTAERLYVATFNLWCYCVFAYLALKRDALINYVALSFAGVFVAVSIVPWLNYVDIGSRLSHDTPREDIGGMVVVSSCAMASDQTFTIPEGYRDFKPVSANFSYYGEKAKLDNGTVKIAISKDLDVRVPLDSIVRAEEEAGVLKPFTLRPLQDPTKLVMVTDLSLTYASEPKKPGEPLRVKNLDYIRLEGVLLSK